MTNPSSQQISRAHLPRTRNLKLRCGQLVQPEGSPAVELLRADSDLATESELAAIRETR